MTIQWYCPNLDCPWTENQPRDVAAKKQFLTTRDTADVLGIPLHGLYKLLQMGTAPPHYKVGKSIYFRASDVLDDDGEQRAVRGGECGRIYKRDAFQQVMDL